MIICFMLNHCWLMCQCITQMMMMRGKMYRCVQVTQTLSELKMTIQHSIIVTATR